MRRNPYLYKYMYSLLIIDIQTLCPIAEPRVFPRDVKLSDLKIDQQNNKYFYGGEKSIPI